MWGAFPPVSWKSSLRKNDLEPADLLLLLLAATSCFLFEINSLRAPWTLRDPEHFRICPILYPICCYSSCREATVEHVFHWSNVWLGRSDASTRTTRWWADTKAPSWTLPGVRTTTTSLHRAVKTASSRSGKFPTMASPGEIRRECRSESHTDDYMLPVQRRTLTEPIMELVYHQRRVGLVMWHPSAQNVLLTAGN